MRYVWAIQIQSSLCPNYGVTCSACGIVGHNLVFCPKVMALKKSTSTPTRVNNKKKRDNNQKKNGNLKILRHMKKKSRHKTQKG